MADYIDLPLVTDSDALLETGVDYLEGAIDGFQARPGNVETVLLEAASQIAAEVVEQAAQVDPVIFATFGAALVGIPIRDATPATGTAQVTFAAATPAVMLPAGSQLAVPHPGGDAVLFDTDTDLVAPQGGGILAVGITAAEEGEVGNGCYGTAELVTVVNGVQLVSIGAATSGGTDQEDADAYLDRLADAFTILAPRPILPQDFATMARQLPGVERAVAIDLYQPGTNDNVAAGQPGGPLNVEGTPVLTGAGATGVARCVSTCILATGGAAPSQSLMHSTWLTLDAAREVNFLAYVIPPKFTTINVKATVTAYPGYVLADVQAAAVAQIQEWLNPANWGSEGTATQRGGGWTSDTKVRIYEAVDYLNRAAGVAWVDSVQLQAGAGAFQSTDITLSGTVPLPVAGPASAQVITVNPAA